MIPNTCCKIFNPIPNTREMIFRPPAIPSRGHLYILDTMRAWAVIWMASFHCLYLPKSMNLTWARSLQYHSFVGWFTNGHLCVDLFFLISGFLICRVILREEHRYKKPLRILRFMCRRILRVWPLYLTVITFHLTVVTSIIPARQCNSPGAVVATVFFVQNFFEYNAMCMPWLWSVAVEVQFYFIIAVLFWLTSPNHFSISVHVSAVRVEQNQLYMRMRKLLCWLMVVCTLVYRLVYVETHYGRFPFNLDLPNRFATDLYTNLAGRLGGLFIGTLCAIYYWENLELPLMISLMNETKKNVQTRKETIETGKQERQENVHVLFVTKTDVLEEEEVKQEVGVKITGELRYWCMLFVGALGALVVSLNNTYVVFETPCAFEGIPSPPNLNVTSWYRPPPSLSSRSSNVTSYNYYYSPQCKQTASRAFGNFYISTFRLLFITFAALFLYAWLALSMRAVTKSSTLYWYLSLFIEHPFWYYVAQVSYGLYLFNPYAVGLLTVPSLPTSFSGDIVQPTVWFLIFVAFFVNVVSLFFGTLGHLLIERPIMNLRAIYFR